MKYILLFICLFFIQLLSSQDNLKSDSKISNLDEFNKTYIFISKRFQYKSDPEYIKYKSISNKCFEWIKANSNIANRNEKIIAIAEIGNIQKDYELALKAQEYYVQMPEAVNSEEFPRICFELGTLHIYLENYPKALYYLNKFVQFDKIKFSDSTVNKYWTSYKELGNIYFQFGNYQEAIKCYKQFYNGVKGKSYYFEPSALNDIGQCYRELKMKDSALYYFKKSIQRIIEYNKMPTTKDKRYILYFKPIVESSMFDYCIEDKKYLEAINLGIREIEGGRVENDFGAISRGYYKKIVGNFYLQNYDEVMKNFEIFEKTLNLKPNTNLYLKALKFKLKTDIILDRKKETLLDISKIDHIDSILRVKNIEEKNELVLKTNLQIKEEEIQTINEQISLTKKASNYKNILIGFVTLFLLTTLLFYLKTRKSNIKIKNQNEIILHEYEKQNILMQEVHHRVKNNLQLVSSFLQIQVNKTKDIKGREVLDESINNINAISLIHENLYKKDQINAVQLNDYLHSLINSIKNTFQNYQDLNIEIKCDPILISIDKTISIGLILNELITNSVKHGFQKNKGTVNIELKSLNQKVHFTYLDNGKGMPIHTLTNEHSLGLKLVKMLIEDLGGTYDLIKNSGFHLQIIFEI